MPTVNLMVDIELDLAEIDSDDMVEELDARGDLPDPEPVDQEDISIFLEDLARQPGSQARQPRPSR